MNHSSVAAWLPSATVLLAVAYSVAAMTYGSVFFSASRFGERWSSVSLRTVLVAHGVLLAFTAWAFQQFPAATASQGLSFMAFAVALVYLIVELGGEERSPGFWMVSVSCLLAWLAVLFRPTTTVPDRQILHEPLFAAHALLAFVAYAAFVVAGAYGFLFIELYRELKTGKLRLFFGKLPSLEALQRMIRGAVKVGFVALSAAMTFGLLLGLRLDQGHWYADPMSVLSAATWAFFAFVLGLSFSGRLEGRRIAWAAVVGLLFILLSLTTLNYLAGSLHG